MRKFNLKVEQEIASYIETIDFSSGYYKKNNNFKCWIIDQKVTWDVLNITCKCIINIVDVEHKTNFKHQDFLKDAYSKIYIAIDLIQTEKLYYHLIMIKQTLQKSMINYFEIILNFYHILMSW